MGFRVGSRRSGRGVSPIVATILLVAITIVLAAVLYILVSQIARSPGKPTIGSALAVASPMHTAKGGNNWYNFSVVSAGTGLTSADLRFQLIDSGGAIVVMPPKAYLAVHALTATVFANYSFASGSWTLGPNSAVTNLDTFVLYSATTSLSGDRLVILGTGSYSSSISVNIG